MRKFYGLARRSRWRRSNLRIANLTNSMLSDGMNVSSIPEAKRVAIVTERSLSPPLTAWLMERGFSHHRLRALDSFNVAMAMRRYGALADGLLLVDYPVESSQDIRTIEAFLDFAGNSPESAYYTPRPNEYYPTDRVALAYFNDIPEVEFGSSLSLRARRVALSILRHPAFPVRARTRFYAAGKAIWRKLEKPSLSHEPVSKPRAQIPEPLKSLRAPMRSFQPEREILYHDLIDRSRHFYPAPLSLHVITLNRCNLKCVMCPYHSPEYKSHHRSGYFDKTHSLNEETFEKIARFAAKNGVSLQFGQIEEALIHPKVIDYIARSSDLGVNEIHLTTNGTLLNEEKAERLARSGVNSVMFSLDAANPETYQKIRGSSLEKVERNLKYFMPLAKKRRIRLTASFILQPQAVDEREAFLKKWRDLGMDQVTFYVLSEHDKETGKMLHGVPHYDPGQRYACASPWHQAVIFPEGEVSLCCKSMTEVGWRGIVSTGDLREAEFEDIWHGEQYAQLRRELIDNKFREFSICADCEIWSATSVGREVAEDFERTFNETMETVVFR